MTDILRRVYFYRAFFKKDGSESNLESIFNHINSLPFTNDGRYFKLDGGNLRSMYVEHSELPFKGIFGTIRKAGLPLLEEMGTTSPLDLPPDAGLYEPMHFMIFPNNVIGFEYNFYGPRINGLKEYLPKKAPNLVDEVELIPLMRTDITELISRMGEIKLFRIGVHRNMGDHLRIINDNLHDAFNKLKEADYSEVIEISLRSQKYSRRSINIPFINRLPNFLTEAKDDVDTAIIKAENTSNENNAVDTFDLLQQYLLTTKSVSKIDDSHRSVNPESMFNAISDAYDELRGEINSIIDETNEE